MCYWTPKIYRFQACPCVFQPRNFTGWGSEGVNSTVCWSGTSALGLILSQTVTPFNADWTSTRTNTWHLLLQATVQTQMVKESLNGFLLKEWWLWLFERAARCGGAVSALSNVMTTESCVRCRLTFWWLSIAGCGGCETHTHTQRWGCETNTHTHTQGRIHTHTQMGMHTHTHTDKHTHTQGCMHPYTHTPVSYTHLTLPTSSEV